MRGLRLIAALLMLPWFVVIGAGAGAWMVAVYYWTGDVPSVKVAKSRKAARSSTPPSMGKHKPGMN